MSGVTFKNVYKIYSYPPNGDIHAVSDFNLEIKDGEVIALLGPSGCGKTSTLFMAAGLEEITKGELYIDDVLVNNIHPKDRGIAMVFHNYALFPFMTVFENIAFGLQPTDMTEEEIKEKVEEVADIAQVRHLLYRKPDKLAGGQKQRVALARAFVRKNKVVCLDEPLSNLDAKLRMFMRTELIKLHDKFKSTFIYVTHDQAEAMAIADRIVIMKEGMIQQVGTPEELYFHPCNLFVGGFLGSPQMNFIDIKHNGRDVIAGIRPEDLYVDEINTEKFKDHAVDAYVEVREFLGDKVYLYGFTKENGWQFTVRVSPDCKFKKGDHIKIAVNPDKMHLFDKETEIAILD
jgi:multiple sugar transport system ATP-binding protein